MFCPRCGQEQITSETKFCSRCGFLLTGVLDLISNNGLPIRNPVDSQTKIVSPRKKGYKQGGQMIFLCLILVPIIGITLATLNLHPALMFITGILTFWGGILRILYARLFESNEPIEDTSETGATSSVQNVLNKKQTINALSASHTNVDNSYIPPSANNWRDTNDLVPHSVIDQTTKLLEKDK